MPDPVATLQDDFNRANEGPPPSSKWTNGIQTFTGGEGLVVLSNQCTRASAGGYRQGSYWNNAQFGPDTCVVVDIAGWVDTNGNGISLFSRLANIGSTTTDGYYFLVERDAGVTVWSFLRLDDNVPTTLGSTVTQAVAAGDQIAMQVIGSTLEGWRKPSAGSWTLILSRTDSTYANAGYVGAEITNNQETVIDNFSAITVAPQRRLRTVQSTLRW